MNKPAEKHRFGFVAVVGPPNAGKSTLVNRMTGTKVSIVSRRPHTTRHRILGIRTMPDSQIVFVDTPGLHFDHRKTLNRQINRTARISLEGVDLILLMIDHHGWTETTRKIAQLLDDSPSPVILLINKTDTLSEKPRLLPLIKESASLRSFDEIIPLSALKDDLDRILLPEIVDRLPAEPAGFPSDQTSGHGPGFQASELLREQIFALLGDELPYETAVQLTRFDQSDPKFWTFELTIWVEREGQKKIIIGKNGQGLKTIGMRTRKALEEQYGVRSRVNIWVKRRQGWRDNLSMLQTLGYTGDSTV